MQKASRVQLLRLTAKYLGRRFEDNSSGDGAGSGIDERPMNNWATLDCVTYIEAVLAPYFAADRGLGNALEEIRYKRQPPTFLHRNHSVRHDWIPNAVSRGLISDVTTARFGAGKAVRRIWRRTPATWYERKVGPKHVHCASNADRLLSDLKRKSRKLRRQRSTYKVIPLNLLLPPKNPQAKSPRDSGWSRLNDLPSGTLLVFFGKGAHLAWLINEAGELKIRHGSRARWSVREDPLADFLRLHAALGYLRAMAAFEVADCRGNSPKRKSNAKKTVKKAAKKTIKKSKKK